MRHVLGSRDRLDLPESHCASRIALVAHRIIRSL
jgi:hypothetical protein